MQCWIAVLPLAQQSATRTEWSTYSYETDARSKKQITPNDLLFFRNESRLLAVARVESVEIENREQVVHKCPVCGAGSINLRKRRETPYRCYHGHQFAAPEDAIHSVVVHTAHFIKDFVRISAPIEPAELRPFESTNSRHLKLKSCDVSGICSYVARRDHAVSPLLREWLRGRTVDFNDADADSFDTPLPGFDEQDRPYFAIRMRRGVAAFREKVLNRYGRKCMISGCSVPALLEACHVSRYQGPQDNHPANGMILRSDLHTLFDLDLIGLNPADLSIAVHPDLMGTEYEKYSGTRLSLGGEKTIDMRAVRSRWELFCRR